MSRFTKINRRRFTICMILFSVFILAFFLREESFIVGMLEKEEMYFEQNRNQPIQLHTEPIHELKHINNAPQATNPTTITANTAAKPQNIFFDQSTFDQLVRYSTEISKNKFPSSWQELNDQLFCPIKYSKTLSPQTTISFADEKLLRILYTLQFKRDCYAPDETNKFLVLDIKTMGTRGLGAVINAGLLKMMYYALYSNRTLILHGKWPWTKNHRYCMHNGTNKPMQGMTCYMLPASNCNYVRLIKRFGAKQEYKGETPSHCNIGQNRTAPHCDERIITINKRVDGWGYFPKPSVIDRFLLYTHRINYDTFRAVCTAFFFRMKSDVRAIVYEKIRNSWIASLDDDHYINPLKTMSLPIRQSDKCTKYIGGEMDCWTIEEYILFLDSVSFLSSNQIDTVIITSESTPFVNNLIQQMKTYNAWNYSKHKWKRVILNKEDVSSEIGASDYLRHNHTFDPRLGTDIRYDPIVGALSSMLLQISNSKYIATTKSSNWLDLIWVLAQHMNCEALFWSQQMEIDSLVVNDANYNNAGDKRRPSFMYNSNKNYLNVDKYCFEFNQWGLANKFTYMKSINYPPDLYEVIKDNFKGYRSFEDIFGIRYARKNAPCLVYDKHPFERSDTLY